MKQVKNMQYKVFQIEKCEVCKNTSLLPVLNLGRHPMCDDLVSTFENRICEKYPIEIVLCDNCLTGHQRFQVPKQLLFPKTYHYRSRFTADVLNGMSQLVESCEKRYGSFHGKTVLDIGCNDGSLLDFFQKKGATTIGIEPTGACEDASKKGHVTFNDFLTQKIADSICSTYRFPDFITFTNVFAHIENLHEVICSLRQLMGPQTVLVIENHYLGSILDKNQFDTFYHEHPRTYSYTSFRYIAKALGTKLQEVEFPQRYGGNIRVFLTSRECKETSSLDLDELQVKERGFLGIFSTLSENIELWKKNKGNFFREMVKTYGKLNAKAFPGRAAILIELLGLSEQHIQAVYEKPGSMKIGHYLPGTRIEIRSDEELFSMQGQEKPLINFAWHISSEIRKYLADHGYQGQVVDIFSQEDFMSVR